MASYDPNGELDELELGGRVASCLLAEEFGALYSELKDRAWSVVLNLYGYMAVQAPAYSANWYPRFDRRGMWSMPGDEGKP